MFFWYIYNKKFDSIAEFQQIKNLAENIYNKNEQLGTEDVNIYLKSIMKIYFCNKEIKKYFNLVKSNL